MDTSLVLGVDIGGSHITSALVDISNKAIVTGSYQRKAVNSQATSTEVLQTWCNAIKQSFADGIITTKIGIAMPGPFDYQNGISLMKDNNKYVSLYGLNVKQLLAEQLHISVGDISFINDAGAFIKGEVFAGAAVGFNSAIGLTLGTGLGTAKYHDGKGEDADLWCMPFKDGIAEDYISTKWFVETYFTQTGKHVHGVKELSALYEFDAAVQNIFYEFATNLSSFLEIFIKSAKPDVIVVGGNIMNCESLFIPTVTALLNKAGFSMPIVRAKLGENAAILGAVS